MSRYLTRHNLSRVNQWKTITQQKQNRIGLSYELGIEGAYQLTANNQVYVTPKFRHSPSNHFNEEVNITLQKSLISMEFGIRAGF